MSVIALNKDGCRFTFQPKTLSETRGLGPCSGSGSAPELTVWELQSRNAESTRSVTKQRTAPLTLGQAGRSRRVWAGGKLPGCCNDGTQFCCLLSRRICSTNWELTGGAGLLGAPLLLLQIKVKQLIGLTKGCSLLQEAMKQMQTYQLPPPPPWSCARTCVHVSKGFSSADELYGSRLIRSAEVWRL